MDIQTTRRMCDLCGKEKEMPADLLEGMAAAPRLISRAVQTAERPSTGWSPAEVAAHLADAEIVLAWRMRQILTLDEPELQPFDQEHWADTLRYSERSVASSLAAYMTVRTSNIEIMRTLSEDQWQRRYRHPEFGPNTLRAYAQHISDHDVEHMGQVTGA